MLRFFSRRALPSVAKSVSVKSPSYLFSTSAVSCTRFIAPIDRTTVPATSQEVPDVEAFLTKIGRNMVEHVDQFESWENLMTMTSYEMKNKGIDTRQRRYLLLWREKYRRGEPLTEHVRGKKRWGGERKRTEVRAKHFGQLRAEQR